MKNRSAPTPIILLVLGCGSGTEASSGAPAPSEGEDSTGKRLFPLGQLLDFDNAFVPDEGEECQAPEGCDGNRPPELGEPLYEWNGRLVPSIERAQQGDVVRILVPYDDPDCNLACGTSKSLIESPREMGEGQGSLPANLPCASKPEEVYVGFRLTVHWQGRHSYWGRLSDVCGERSAGFSGEFVAE